MILYATTFTNEQTASGVPARLVPVNNGATVAGQSIDTLGYAFQVTLPVGATWELPLPVPETALRYIKRYAEIRINAGGPNTSINLHGFPIIDGSAGTAKLLIGQLYKVCTVYDTVTNSGKAYINSRFVGASSNTSGLLISRSIDTGTATASLRLTNILIEASTNGQPISAEFIDQQLTEITNNGWTFTGTSLLESIDKVNVTDTLPNTRSFTDGGEFTVQVSNQELPQLIEMAGSIESGPEDTVLTVQVGDSTEFIELKTTQSAFASTITSNGNITIGRTARN